MIAQIDYATMWFRSLDGRELTDGEIDIITGGDRMYVQCAHAVTYDNLTWNMLLAVQLAPGHWRVAQTMYDEDAPVDTLVLQFDDMQLAPDDEQVMRMLVLADPYE